MTTNVNSGLRSFQFLDESGKPIFDVDDNCRAITIIRDDGMRIDICVRRSDGHIAISAGNGTLVVHPRGSNLIYVREGAHQTEKDCG